MDALAAERAAVFTPNREGGAGDFIGIFHRVFLILAVPYAERPVVAQVLQRVAAVVGIIAAFFGNDIQIIGIVVQHGKAFVDQRGHAGAQVAAVLGGAAVGRVAVVAPVGYLNVAVEVV